MFNLRLVNMVDKISKILSKDFKHIPKLALTQDNEDEVRSYLMRRWEDRWLIRRREHLHSKVVTRYTKRETPIDLSGSCYLVNQFCYVIFDLSGEYHSNTRHGFVVLGDGTIYDLNRNCHDVQSMSLKGRKPYEVNYKEHSVRYPKNMTHRPYLERLVGEFSVLAGRFGLELANKKRPVRTVPAWAKAPYAKEKYLV